MRGLKALHDALKESRPEKENVLCNLVVKVMCGECHDASFYLYNYKEKNTMADHDQWSWIFDLNNNTWTTTNPFFEGRALTIEEVDAYIRNIRPCLYKDCPCEEYGKDPYCNKSMWDSIYKSREVI